MLTKHFATPTLQDDVFVAQVARLLRPQHFRPGELVCREGEMGLDMYFLVRGQVAIMKRTQDDELIEAGVRTA